MAVIRDPEVCESCTQYTDPAKLITINTGDYHADIYFDRLEDMPLSNIRKVFKLLLADPWSNEGAIRQMTLYLDAAVIESKEAWKQASSIRTAGAMCSIRKAASKRTAKSSGKTTG